MQQVIKLTSLFVSFGAKGSVALAGVALSVSSSLESSSFGGDSLLLLQGVVELLLAVVGADDEFVAKLFANSQLLLLFRFE